MDDKTRADLTDRLKRMAEDLLAQISVDPIFVEELQKLVPPGNEVRKHLSINEMHQLVILARQAAARRKGFLDSTDPLPGILIRAS